MSQISNISNMTIINNSLFTHSVNSTTGNIILIGLFTVVIAWTVLGNATVILSVKKTPALWACPSNILIANLALSDLLLGAMVLPLSAMVEVLGWWPLPKELCFFWLVIDVLLCTASIWGLVAIATDRYTATFYPLSYRTKRRLPRIAAYIAVVWVVSAVTSIPPLTGFGGLLQNSYQADQNPPTCSLLVTIDFAIYSSIMTFIAPTILLFILYGRIFVEIRHRTQAVVKMKSMFKKSMQVDGAKEEQIEQKLQELEVEESSSSQHEEICNLPEKSLPSLDKQESEVHSDDACSLNNDQDHSAQQSFLIKCESQKKISMLKKLTSKRKKDRREERATKIMLTIMLFFMICWLPFFIMYIIRSALTKTCPDCVPLPLQSVLIWLGYLNSGGNPILYAVFNRQFKDAFITIWCSRLKELKRKTMRRLTFYHRSDSVTDSVL